MNGFGSNEGMIRGTESEAEDANTAYLAFRQLSRSKVINIKPYFRQLALLDLGVTNINREYVLQ